jgi:hypothetical protein
MTDDGVRPGRGYLLVALEVVKNLPIFLFPRSFSMDKSPNIAKNQ